MRTELETKDREIAKLRAALIKHGRCDAYCSANYGLGRACDCGLAVAIKGEGVGR